VLVFGATGRQGSSVVKHLLKDGSFTVKGFSRLEEEKKFEEKCDFIKGNLKDKNSVLQAMKGADLVYAVSDFWDDPEHPEAELEQGKNIMDAAKEIGVKHVVFSSLENTSQMTSGQIECECCDKKAEIFEHGKSLNLPLTEIRLAFYMENFLHRLRPQKRQDGTVVFDLPIGAEKLDLICAEDIGGVVLNIFKNKDKFLGKCVKLAGDSLTGKEIADTYSKITGDKAIFEPIPIENFKQKVTHGAIIAKMFQFYQRFSGKLRDIEETKKVYPDVKNFDTWLKYSKFKV